MGAFHSIKRIFLHTGIHKTGSTSIQYSLGHSGKYLAEEGYLFPEFSYKKELFNHSVPLHLACHEHFEVFKRNRAVKTDNIQPDGLQRNYFVELINQVESFKGESLIFSGENLSTWEEQEIQGLKHLIRDYIGEFIEIVVIVYVRHPVEWAQSFIAQQVIDGRYTLEKSIQSMYDVISAKYRTSIEKFMKVFPEAQFNIVRLEDAIDHPYGVVGHFLSLMGIGDNKLKNIKICRVNESKSAAAIHLISEINRKVPYEIRKEFNLQPLNNIPGGKFRLTKQERVKMWDSSREDQKWLYNTTGLDEYKFDDSDLIDSDIWNHENLMFVGDILKKMNPDIRDVIMKIFQ
jgi:hypothetical protein